MTKPKTKTIQPVPDDNKSHKGPGSAPSVPLDTTKGHRDDEKHNIREQAAQCGYCLNGMIITTKALLTRNPNPSEHEVLEALRYNLCRCGAHIEIIRAAMRAAGHALEARG